MAEAFAKIHGGDGVRSHSAGSRPAGVVNPKAIASMGEIGYDLSTHTSKSLKDECPFVPAKHRDDWEIPDPKNMPPDEFRKVRDEIKRRVKDLLMKTD
jgi:protein-tyrosine-phosphatase